MGEFQCAGGGDWRPGFSNLIPYSEAEVLIEEHDFANTESILACFSFAQIKQKQDAVKEIQNKLCDGTYGNLLMAAIAQVIGGVQDWKQ